MNKIFNRSIITGIMLMSIVVMFQNCKRGTAARPKWADINEKVIKEHNVTGRTRTDIPDTKVASNLKNAQVVNIADLPAINLAEGVTAKAYWGKGALMSFITLVPNAVMPEQTIKGERFMYVLTGNVQELINGIYVNLKAILADVPDGTHGAVSKREFVYLQEGAKTAIKAGNAGAKILEVYRPVPAEYLEKAGVKDIPQLISLKQFPVKPTVEPNMVYDLDDFQYTELVPGANSRILSGYGVQMSFLRMDPNSFFARHIHPEEQVMIVLRGWINEIILDKVVQMKDGDILDLPSGLVHGGTIGPFGCDVLDVFFPPRTDYDSFRVARQEGYNAIISKDAKVNVVIDGANSKPGLTFTEGPAWLNGKLYFSNMFFDTDWNGSPAKSTLVEMSLDGTYKNIIENKMQTNGIMTMTNNHLIVCDMFGHRVVEMDTTGKILKVLADSYEGKPIDGPNDLVMDAKGGIYFSDPQFTSDVVKHQPGRTIYYITPQGKLIRLLKPDEFAMPNGLALSPDDKTLYIANTYDNEKFWNVNSGKDNFIWAYDVKEDGTIINSRKFAELYLTGIVLNRQGKSSGADGLKVDANGNVYVATYAGLQIFNQAGKFVGIINLPTYPVNFTFGGPDLKTLYITSYNKIYSIRINVKGLIHPN
jgi:gluconolactonase